MPRELTPQERELKRQATEAKAADRRKLAAKDRLRALGARRNGNLQAKAKIDGEVLAELPRALAEGVTYDEMEALTGLSRSRVAQVLKKWRDDHGMGDGEPGEPGPIVTPAPTSNGASVVAAVGDL